MLNCLTCELNLIEVAECSGCCMLLEWKDLYVWPQLFTCPILCGRWEAKLATKDQAQCYKVILHIVLLLPSTYQQTLQLDYNN